jgi:hypothetical protein
MSLSFAPRLLCLALACFFLVYLITTLTVSLWTPLAIRKARQFAPARAATLLLTLRLLPSGLALFAALGLCVPSYLWFEPERFDEPVGLACIVAALLGCALAGIAIARAARAFVHSSLLARLCRRSGQQLALAGQYPPVVVLNSARPLLALTGIVRPQVVISRSLADALSDEELKVVLGHESAHQSSRDNLKRLCIFLSPWSLPLLDSGARLERSWVSCAEFAADEQAVAADDQRALQLASALVRVARAGSMRPAVPLSISFLADASDLSARVDRLLTGSSRPESSSRVSWRPAGLALMLAACLVCNPPVFRLVQAVLERLVH